MSKDEAFYHLTGLLAEPVTRFLRVRFSSISCDEAADLFQEFMLRFYKSEESLNPKDSRPLMPFLWRIASNLKIDYLRKKNRESAALAAISKSNVQAADSVETHEAVREALEGLTEEDRAIACLFWGFEYSYAEIAQSIGLPQSTVQGRLRAIRKRFAKHASRSLAGMSDEEQSTGEVRI